MHSSFNHNKRIKLGALFYLPDDFLPIWVVCGSEKQQVQKKETRRRREELRDLRRARDSRNGVLEDNKYKLNENTTEEEFRKQWNAP